MSSSYWWPTWHNLRPFLNTKTSSEELYPPNTTTSFPLTKVAEWALKNHECRGISLSNKWVLYYLFGFSIQKINCKKFCDFITLYYHIQFRHILTAPEAYIGKQLGVKSSDDLLRDVPCVSCSIVLVPQMSRKINKRWENFENQRNFADQEKWREDDNVNGYFCEGIKTEVWFMWIVIRVNGTKLWQEDLK